MILHSQPTIADEDIAAVVAVLKSGHLEDGEIVEEFERRVAAGLGRRYAIATTNGFAAIHLALIGLDVGPHDEVLMPSYSCPALLNPVVVQQAIPIVLDTGHNSVNLSVEAVRRHLSTKTKALIVPHMFGFPAPIDAIRSVSQGVPIIEDCAQGVGATRDGRLLGSLSEVAILSFYASKLMCAGDAGMVLTDDPTIYRKMKDHHYYGHKPEHRCTSMNYHLTNMPAALGLSQFSRLDTFIDTRRRLAAAYDDAFRAQERIWTDFESREQSLYYRYPVRLSHRDRVMEDLRKHGIGTGFGVLNGLHQLTGGRHEDFPNTERLLREVVSLPLYPKLSLNEVQFVAASLVNAVSQ